VSEPRRAAQAELVAAARRYSTAAGSAQPDLRSPLTESELAAGEGFGVAISSVDMTPRPRYGESRQAFEARMQSYGIRLSDLRRETNQRNRQAALRSVDTRHGLQYFTQCACGFCGLRVEDPEVARREYDAHDCAAAGVGQAAVDRAITGSVEKRTAAVLKPALGEADREQLRRTVEAEDEAVARFAQLELK
jgi:hypothetical protein